MNVTKEQFHAYLGVQYSGITNMFHGSRVIDIARDRMKVILTEDDLTYIMQNYAELKEEYGDIQT